MKHLLWLWAICWLSFAHGLQAQRLSNQYTFGYNQVFPLDKIGSNHVVWGAYKRYLKKGFFVGVRADYHMEENNYVLRDLPLEPDWYLLSVEERFALAGAVSHDDLDAGIKQFETMDWRDTDIYFNLTTGYTFVFWRERLNLSLFGGFGVTYKQRSGVVSGSSNYVTTDPALPQVEGSILYPGYKRGLTPSPLAGFEFAYQVSSWLLGINAVFNPEATTIITHGLLVGRQF
jgi:hypothetical protein